MRIRITFSPLAAQASASSALKTARPTAAPGEAGKPVAMTFFRSLRVKHRMQQLVKLVGTDAHNGFFFVQQAFFDHFDGHADSGLSGTFAVTALQHPEFAVFNGKFHILHVFVVGFEVVANVNQLFVQVRPFFFQRSAVALEAIGCGVRIPATTSSP